MSDHATRQVNELRLEIESIRSNVKRTSCAEDRKEDIVKLPKLTLLGGAQIPVVTADVVEGQSVDNKAGTIQITSAFWEHEIGELKGSNMELNDLRHGVVPISKNLVNMLICSFDYEGLIENSQMVRNPAILREPSGEEGIINSVNSESVCSQEVVTDLLPETYTQSLMNVPNGDLVAVKINGSNVQTNGQVSFQLHRPGMTDELLKGGSVGVERSINTC
ncbi:hypothetical protein TNCV_1311471 [Trichonephila clavipes]|nr:hypothetical protein TNCV_1311471 [Trichonephila clavipes]